MITAGQGKSETLGQMRLNICLKNAGKRNWLTGSGNITVRSVRKAGRNGMPKAIKAI